jgi:hypothetical protein
VSGTTLRIKFVPVHPEFIFDVRIRDVQGVHE